MWNNKKSYCLSYFQSDFLFPAAQCIMTNIKAISSKGQKQRKLAYPVRTGAVSEGPEGSEQCKQASSFALPSTLLHVCLKVGMENKDHTWPLSQFWFGHKASTSKTLSWVRAVSVFHGPWITRVDVVRWLRVRLVTRKTKRMIRGLEFWGNSTSRKERRARNWVCNPVANV